MTGESFAVLYRQGPPHALKTKYKLCINEVLPDTKKGQLELEFVRRFDHITADQAERLKVISSRYYGPQTGLLQKIHRSFYPDVRAILTDIIGTTSPNRFTRALWLDFRQNGVEYIKRADQQALKLIGQIKKEARLKNEEDVVRHVLEQIADGKSKPVYIELRGLMNNEGYAAGRLFGKFYDDVPDAFQRWKDNGKEIYVFSNTSAESQKAMFEHYEHGDLSVFINAFFGTQDIGGKCEPRSYEEISKRVNISPADILFLSDLEVELDAASKAGMLTEQVVRLDGKIGSISKYPVIHSFKEI